MIFLYTLCLIIQGSLALISSTPDVNINSGEFLSNTSDVGESTKLLGFTSTTTLYTHHVSIFVQDSAGTEIDVCSGSLISTIFILTSASCVIRGTIVTVRYGSSDGGAGTGPVTISEVITHPKFERNTLKYDIALLRLPAAVTLGAQVSIVSLPTTSIGIKDNKDFEGQTLRVVGWPLLAESTAFESVVRRSYVDMRVLTASECSTAMKASDFNIYYPTMSCFSNTNTAGTQSVGACKADKGGEVMYSPNGSGGNQQVGVVTNFRRCGETTIWTRIGPMLSWIRQHL